METRQVVEAAFNKARINGEKELTFSSFFFGYVLTVDAKVGYVGCLNACTDAGVRVDNRTGVHYIYF